MNAYIRMRWAFTEEIPTIKAYDEKVWAELDDYEMPMEPSLGLLEALQKTFIHPSGVG